MKIHQKAQRLSGYFKIGEKLGSEDVFEPLHCLDFDDENVID